MSRSKSGMTANVASEWDVEQTDIEQTTHTSAMGAH